MPFTQFELHPDLLRGIKELGYARPTPIQAQAIPPATEGRDVLACAMTGSGKTVAFLLPILHRLLKEKRGTTRALIVTPTRELAAQIEQAANEVAVHTPLTCAAIFGGVGMGPQEHAFRAGVDILVATPGRLLDHLSKPYASLEHIKYLVLDEADRMLDMGFLPDIKRVLRQVPAKRQTLLFSATMPAPIAALTKEILHNPVTIDLQRKAAPATGITQAVYPVAQDLKPALLLELLKRGDVKDAIVFTRTKHRTNRLFEYLHKHGVKVERLHGNRSQSQRTQALAGFKDGTVQVLVATDIAARGIDVEELSHVVNLDVPAAPEDYIHRVGRTARAEATGEAYTFVAPDEEGDLAAIERAVGKRLPRVTVPGFNYQARPEQRFEVPIAERIAEIRKRKAEERARAKEKAERKAQRQGGEAPRQGGGGARRAASSSGRGEARPERGEAERGRPARDGQPSRDGQRRPAGPPIAGAPLAGGGAGRRRRRGGRGRGPGGGSPGTGSRQGGGSNPYR